MADGTQHRKGSRLSAEEVGRRVLEGARAGGRARRGKGVQRLVRELLQEYSDRVPKRDLAARVARLAHCTPAWVRRVRKKTGTTGA